MVVILAKVCQNNDRLMIHKTLQQSKCLKESQLNANSFQIFCLVVFISTLMLIKKTVIQPRLLIWPIFDSLDDKVSL